MFAPGYFAVGHFAPDYFPPGAEISTLLAARDGFAAPELNRQEIPEAIRAVAGDIRPDTPIAARETATEASRDISRGQRPREKVSRRTGQNKGVKRWH